MAVMRAEGLERVTMRRLAQELDTGAASLYVYVRNTAELHAAMLEELLGQIDLSPVTADGDWRDRLTQVLTSYTAILFEHPGLAQSALVTRPSGPAYFGLVTSADWARPGFSNRIAVYEVRTCASRSRQSPSALTGLRSICPSSSSSIAARSSAVLRT